MRLLITGGSGLLGGNLAFIAAASHQVHATYHRHPVAIPGCRMHPLDLEDKRDIARLLNTDLIFDGQKGWYSEEAAILATGFDGGLSLPTLQSPNLSLRLIRVGCKGIIRKGDAKCTSDISCVEDRVGLSSTRAEGVMRRGDEVDGFGNGRSGLPGWHPETTAGPEPP